MAVKIIGEETPAQDVFLRLHQYEKGVSVRAQTIAGQLWDLGTFEQDSEGRLFFRRATHISASPYYPKVLLEEGSSKIKFT